MASAWAERDDTREKYAAARERTTSDHVCFPPIADIRLGSGLDLIDSPL